MWLSWGFDNKIMRVGLKNENQFFKHILNLRKSKETLYPSVLNTAAGKYSGTNILKAFTADAEYLGRAVDESLQLYKQIHI